MPTPHETVDWQARYDEGRAHWQRPGTNPVFDAWMEAGVLAPGCAVLVPGCGRSHELLELARRGFSVTGIDLVPAAVEVMRARLTEEGLSAEVVQADLFAWEPGRTFDAIYEQTCLCALHPDDWQAYVARLHTWLRPGGLLCALFMQTGRPGGPPFHCDLERMRTLFDDGRWEWPAAEPLPSPHPASPEIHELGFVLVRRG